MIVLSGADFCLLAAAFMASLIPGSLHLRFNLWLFAVISMLIGIATALTASTVHDSSLYMVACLIFVSKGVLLPKFLSWMSDMLGATRDPGAVLPAPLSMHLCLVLMALSFYLAQGIPSSDNSRLGAAFGISLLLSGLIVMLSRKLAITQVVGFLILENGIYTFALTQTRGMPLMIEMGILLDLLVAVMVAGLLIFKIQKSFEHIDVTRLTDLRD